MISNLMAWAAQTTMLIAVAVSIPVVLRVRSARAQLVVFQAVLFAMLLLPVLQPWRHPIVETSVFTVEPMAESSAPVVVAGASTFDWERAVLYAVVAGAGARGVWLVLGLLRLRRYRRYAQRITINHMDVSVAVSTEVTGPVTFGWRRPIVLVPPAFLDMPEEQREAVMTHEWLHVQRHDWLFCVAEEVAVSVMWFHPAAWFLISRIRTLREQVVDAEALSITRNQEGYIEALLTMAQTRPMLDVAAAPLFLRKRDLTDRVKNILEARVMSVRRILCSYACVIASMAAVIGYATSTFPLVGAPIENEFEVRGVLSRIDVSPLPEPLRWQVEARLATYRNAPFTTDLMLRIKASIAALDSRIDQNWVEEAPRVYSLSLAYRSGEPVTEVRLVRIDVSRLPEPRRSQVEARVSSFLNAPFKDSLMQNLQSTVALIDRKIEYKWSYEPGGHMVLTFLHDAPAGSWQPVNGILARIDTSQLPEPDRSLMQQRLAKYVNAPYTNKLMSEISVASQEVSRKWALTWRTEAPEVSSLTIGLLPPEITSGQRTSAPNFPSDGEMQVFAGGAAQAKKLKTAPTPVYPPLALQAGIQGVVRFNVQIGKDGRVKRMQVVSGHPLLVEAAKDALARYEYEPALLNGEPVQVLTVVDVNFTLNR